MRLTILTLLSFLTLHSSAQRFDWATSGGYSGIANSFNGAVDIAVDPDGNLYTMDSANGEQQCQDMTFAPYSSTTTFIYKFSPEGVLLLGSRVGANGGSFVPFNLECDEDGNLYLLGQPDGVNEIMVNDVAVAVTPNTNQLIKMDPLGNFIWSINTGFGTNGEGCMLQYSDGFIYFQNAHLAVVKVSTEGEVMDTVQGTYYSSPTSSMGLLFKGSGTFSNGDLLFAALSRGSVSFGTDTLENVGNPFLTAPILLMRCSPEMDIVWARYLSNVRDPDKNFIPVAIDSEDGVYIGAQVNSEMTVGDDIITGDVGGIGTGAVAKIDGNGNDVWGLAFQSTNFAIAWCMRHAHDGTGIWVGGGWAGTATFGDFTMPNAPNGLPFMAKINYDGEYLDVFNYIQEPSQTDAMSLADNGNGVYYVGGKLPNATIPSVSCTEFDANKGFYLGAFTENPNEVPSPVITVDGATLTASPAFDGLIEWFLNGQPIAGENGLSITATESGVYSVSYTYETGCTGTAFSDVVNIVIEGVAENTTQTLNIYPNPASEWVMVNTLSKEEILIWSSTGALVQRVRPGTGNTQRIDLSGMAAGAYVARQGTSSVVILVK
jgi:hypothetical protein